MRVRPMTPQDRDTVLPMANALYHSPAVGHPVPAAIMEHAFSDAVGEDPHLEGYVLESDGVPAGFAYLTFFYSCEVAGDVVMIEELFVKDAFRGKGLGQQFLDWLRRAYPKAVRFRLEVTRDNPAAHLYQRNGFEFIDYGQMVCDI